MSKLTPDEWRKVSPYLDEALEMVPGERDAWLLSLTQKDARLASLVQALLDEQRKLKQESFLERSPLGAWEGNVLRENVASPFHAGPRPKR
jgi:hypothetical protein